MMAAMFVIYIVVRCKMNPALGPVLPPEVRAMPMGEKIRLLGAGLLPLFSLDEISVLTGLQSLWASDIFLALLVTAFALFAPYLKTIGLALVHADLLSDRLLPALTYLGKLAMADVFLIALYVVVIKGIGVGKVETAWGLYLFTACILASLLISALTARQRDRIATATK